MKKFALVGCGKVAVHHAENILRLGKLVAVCETVPEKRDAFANTYGANAYNTIDDLLACEKDIEVVVICTPNGLHAEHIIKSLQAKKHVLCEGPLCLTTAAAWQIIETEKFCRRRLFVVNTALQNPVLKKLKTALSEGILGDVYSFQVNCFSNLPTEHFANWRGKLFPGGGLLYTTFSQYIDAMVLLFGEIANVQGFKRNTAHMKSFDAEDTGTVALQMQNGNLGTLHWLVNALKESEISFTIIAEKGVIRIGGEDLMSIQSDEPEIFLPTQQEENALFRPKPASDMTLIYNEMIKAFDNKDASIAGTFDGLKTVETIEKIYKAISPA